MDKPDEKPPETSAQPSPAAPKQAGQDIAPPPAAEKTAAQPPQSADAPATPPAEEHAPAGEEQHLPEHPEPPKPKKAKQPGNHVGLAITATIIIVLALSALATFAFLQTK